MPVLVDTQACGSQFGLSSDTTGHLDGMIPNTNTQQIHHDKIQRHDIQKMCLFGFNSETTGDLDGLNGLIPNTKTNTIKTQIRIHHDKIQRHDKHIMPVWP